MSGRSFDDFQFEHGFGHEIRRAVTRNPAPPPEGVRRIAEITAPFPSWPGLSRPSTSWIINTLVYYRNLIQRRGEFYANHPIYLN